MNPVHSDPDMNVVQPILECCACVCGETAVADRQIKARDEVHGGMFAYATCARCATERVSPRPTPEDIGRYYPNTYYAYVGAADHRVSAATRFKRAVYETFYAEPGERGTWTTRLRWLLIALLFPLRFRTNLAFRAPTQRCVFEIGAATGTDLLEFRAAGWQVTGCEPSEKACAVAQKRGITLQNCSAELAVMAPHQFGCVLINNVFEHLHDPVRVLEKVRCSLINDGVLVIIVPNHASWAARVFGAAWPGYDPPRHLWGFTAESIRDLLRRTGFELEYIAHKAPQRWCWEACVAGTRLPGGATPLRSRLARPLATLLVPLGALLSLFERGDFIKVVARNSR